MRTLSPTPLPLGQKVNSPDHVGPPNTDSNTDTDNGYTYDSISSTNLQTTRSLPPAIIMTKISNRVLAPDLVRGLLMVFMACDHLAIAFRTWRHGTNKQSESDGTLVDEWNFTTAYIVRTLTHLCAPGFTFLMGMGVVYLGQSRSVRHKWSSWRILRYLATRMAVLTVVNVLFGWVLTMGKLWFLNMVLFALAVDYFLAGLIWLAINKSEPALARILEKVIPLSSNDSEEDAADIEQPLLPGRQSSARLSKSASTAASVSWHLHNLGLFALSVVTIYWNVWLSPNNGHCLARSGLPADSPPDPVAAALTFSVTSAEMVTATTALDNTFLRLWFWPVSTQHVMSGFPPLAWVSFAILGLLYGRIIASRPWTLSVSAAHILTSALFAAVFVLTRVFRFGNLSEDCLHTPDQEHHPRANPYLVSPASLFYIVKYPPDVAFWAFTMAGNLFLLAIMGAIPARIAQRMSVLLDFGTSALFFYIVHLMVAFGLAAVLVPLFGHDTGIPDPGGNTDFTRGIDSLPGYFAIVATLVVLLWPLCRAYSRFKSTKAADSLWRFF